MKKSIAGVLGLVALVAGGAAWAKAGSTTGNSQTQTFRQAKRSYKDASAHYMKEVRAYMRKRYRKARRRLLQTHEYRITKQEKRERKARKRAIQVFLAFLRKYPRHRIYSPDVMYRLAELLYEEEFEQYLARAGRYEKQIKRYENKEIAQEPKAPRKRFVRTVRWLERLVKGFPRYRFAANAYYLLGYCKNEEGQWKQALAHFRTLTRLRPTPPAKLRAEAWVRIGELYFLHEKYARARQAYTQALAFKKSGFYDKTLYKLGWISYLKNEFPQAIGYFTRLLEHYQKSKKKSQDTLSQEAIQYIATCFADEQWGRLSKVLAYVRKVGPNKPFVREILEQLTRYYRMRSQWGAVIALSQKMLQMAPTDPANPLLRRQMLQALLGLRRFGLLSRVRADFARMLRPGSRWHRSNRHKVGVLRRARKAYGESLFELAVYAHLACQKLHARSTDDKQRPEVRRALARESQSFCLRAAGLYKDLLGHDPHHKQRETYLWYRSDALFLAGRFRKASEGFQALRDNRRSKYRRQAALALIESLAQQLHRACRVGQITRGCEIKLANPPKGPPKSRAIPALQRKLIEARIGFLAQRKQKKDVDRQMLLLAHTYFSYYRHKQALNYLWMLVRTYPKSKYFRDAAQTIVAIGWRKGDLKKVEATIARLRRIGGPFLKKGAVRNLRLLRAERLQKQKKYRQAARLYAKAYNDRPAATDAPSILWNAAYNAEQARQIQRALKLFEQLLKRHPRWKLLHRVQLKMAALWEGQLRLNKAIVYYRALASRPNPHRSLALFNVAVLLETLKRYEAAGDGYLRFFKRYPRHADAIKALYQATLAYQKAGNQAKHLGALRRFLRQARGRRGLARLRLLAYGQWLDVVQKQRLSAAAKKRFYRKVLRLFRKLRPLLPAQDLALVRWIPARIEYSLLMDPYRKFKAMPLRSRNSKVLIRQFRKKIQAYEKIARRLGAIHRFGSAPWLMCAMFRVAQGKQILADDLRKAPLPKVKGAKWTQEDIENYKDQLFDRYIRPLEDDASNKYKQVLKAAGRLFIRNGCVKQAQRALRKMQPSTPLPKAAPTPMPQQMTSPLPLLKRLRR